MVIGYPEFIHVGAKLSYQHFPTGRGGRRNLDSEVLGDLYGEAAHATGAPGDEDALPARDEQFIAQRLKRGESGKGNGGGVRKVEARGCQGRMVLLDDRELANGPILSLSTRANTRSPTRKRCTLSGCSRKPGRAAK
jgi:hypothetical protein